MRLAWHLLEYACLTVHDHTRRIIIDRSMVETKTMVLNGDRAGSRTCMLVDLE